MLNRRQMMQTLLGGAIGAPLLGAQMARAQEAAGFPAKPVRLIVPFSPGSLTDATSRLFAPRMAEALGGNIVVENMAGASGVVGSDYVAKADPDGYTLVMGGVTSHGTLMSLSKDLPYDVRTDFTPVGLVVAPPAIFAVHPSVPANTFKEFIEWSKNEPDGVSFASSGNGSSGHLTAELLSMRTGANLVQIPYNNVGQAITDLVAGQVKMMIYYAPLLPHIQSGALRGLAVLSDERASFAPEIPTALEQGYEGVTSTGWTGIFAPVGIETGVRDRLYQALEIAMNEPRLQQSLSKQGQEPKLLGPDAFRDFVAAEIEKWAEVVEAAGLSPT